MAAGLAAVASLPGRPAATITLDSYTRVGDHAAARAALASGAPLNGFPLVAHGPEVTRRVTAGVGVPVQVRHGSADPRDIFATMSAAGLFDSEGGPVSYCLPYGRTPLARSVGAWRDAVGQLAEAGAAVGRIAHLETFGGCLLGQLCPPSLLVAVSLLEALFFAQHGIRSVSLSYAQQTNLVQDIEALAALRMLAGELLPTGTDFHLVLYTYMGVFPRAESAAAALLRDSAELAAVGGAERLIVKTVAESHRIPTVDENLRALRVADRAAHRATRERRLPGTADVDCSQILAEARAMVEAVLQFGDVGDGLLAAFRQGTLDVPFCLHQDNQGLTQATVAADGRLEWVRTGKLPIPPARSRRRLTSDELLLMLRHTADRYDLRAALRGRGRPWTGGADSRGA